MTYRSEFPIDLKEFEMELRVLFFCAFPARRVDEEYC